MKKSKIIASFAGFALFTSSALALTSVSNGNTTLIRNSSVLSTKEDLVDLKTIKSFNYGNSFANSYSSNIVLGVNKLTNNWTNVAIRCSGTNVTFNGYAQMSDDGRILTDSNVAGSNWFSNIKSGSFTGNGTGFFGALMDFNANESKVATSGAMQAMNMPNAYLFNEVLTSTNGSSPTGANSINTSNYSLQEPVYASFDLAGNQALSVGIEIHSSTVFAEMRMATDGTNITDTAPKIQTYSSLSQFDRTSTDTEGATYTFANQSFGVSSDGMDVYSGTTGAITDSNLVVEPITTLSEQDIKLLASEYLAKNKAKVAQAISLNLTNAYPGTVYNSLSFTTDDTKGTISVNFKPKSVLENGIVKPYTGGTITKEIASGFFSSSFSFKESNSKQAIVAASLGVIIPGVILVGLFAVGLRIYEKQKAKYKEFTYEI